MKLTYLLTITPFITFTLAAPNPEMDNTPLDLQTRQEDPTITGRVSCTICGIVDNTQTKLPQQSSGKMWFMFTYETTCPGGRKVSVTADQSHASGLKDLFKATLLLNLEKFEVDEGPFKGQFSANVDIISGHPGAKVSFKGGPEIPLGEPTNTKANPPTPKDHAKCLTAQARDKSTEGDGDVLIWDNVAGIPKDFGCDKK